MNQKTKLAAALVMAGSVSMAQAALYNVSANFFDGGIQAQTHRIHWQFRLGRKHRHSKQFYRFVVRIYVGVGRKCQQFKDKKGGLVTAGDYKDQVYAKPGGYSAGDAPLLNLTHQLASSESGNLVTVSTFLQNSTDVVKGGGYDVVSTNNAITYGNKNAFFSLVFG